MKPQSLKGLDYCVKYRHKNTQDARQVQILGAERRAPPLPRLSPAVSLLLTRIAPDIILSPPAPAKSSCNLRRPDFFKNETAAAKKIKLLR
jgi:hypothetical protein